MLYILFQLSLFSYINDTTKWSECCFLRANLICVGISVGMCIWPVLKKERNLSMISDRMTEASEIIIFYLLLWKASLMLLKMLPRHFRFAYFAIIPLAAAIPIGNPIWVGMILWRKKWAYYDLSKWDNFLSCFSYHCHILNYIFISK